MKGNSEVWELKAPALVSSAPKETWLLERDSFENTAELGAMPSAASIIYHWNEKSKPESGRLRQKSSTLESCHTCFFFEGYYPRKKTLNLAKPQVVKQILGHLHSR